MEEWTIKKLLEWVTDYLSEKGIESPRLSAEMLLSHILDVKRIELYMNFEQQVSKPHLAQLRELVKRAGQFEPIAYLTGKTEFYSLEFTITPDCLIPRPETELLVQRAIELLKQRNGKQLVCDLCTGSGCISVAIAKNYPQATITATDISDAALKIAEQNAEKYKVSERINFLHGDIFDALIPQIDKSKFDLVVCNPPYVSTAEYENLDKNVKDFEPQTALLAGDEGLDVYRKILEQIEPFFKDDSILILEIGYAQGNSVKELIENTQLFGNIAIEKDFHNNDRIVISKRKSGSSI